MAELNSRILIVDDEPEIRLGYQNALDPEPVEVLRSTRSRTAPPETPEPRERFVLTLAAHGEEALALFREAHARNEPFAVAFVDVRMPGQIDGLQFIREAWRIDPKLLVVVVTAYQDRSVDEICRMFGPQFQDQWDYLNKPFTSGEILQKARQLVSSWNRREREKALLDQVKEQERLAAVGRVARSIGHEFGNLLQPLITHLEIMKEQPQPNPEKIDEMLESVMIGANICRDLLTFAREDQPSSTYPRLKSSAEVGAVELASPVTRTLRLLRHELKRKDIQVESSVPTGMRADGHESRLVQVFVNLIKNAIDAVPAGGRITVTASRQAGGRALIEIRDNGAGISEADQKHLFEPLFTTKEEFGSGLGLVVCKQIVEEFQGTIQIESTLGRGTTVRITLPLA